LSSPVPRARALFASATAKGSAATRRTSSWWGRKGLRSAHLGGEWIQGSGGLDSDTHGEAGASACHDGGRRCHDAGPVHGGERGTAAMANDPLAVLALRTHTRSARNREKEGARASTHHWRLLLVLSITLERARGVALVALAKRASAAEHCASAAGRHANTGRMVVGCAAHGAERKSSHCGATGGGCVQITAAGRCHAPFAGRVPHAAACLPACRGCVPRTAPAC